MPFELPEGQEAPKHVYTVEVTRAMFAQESFELYQKYQNSVHGKDESDDKTGYERFLCQVPLFDPKDKDDSEESKSGSNRRITSKNDSKADEFRTLKDEGVWPKYRGGYHMLHRIDGKLFAVGVNDYTTTAFSSVYLFYDPDNDFLSPGNFCALREIEYMRKVRKEFDETFKYYYMGLYFQDCVKSVYKANFKPS